VDGIGLVQRRYFGLTPLGIPFSKMAGMVSGGAQNHGFKGISVRGMRDKDFLIGDGGWNRIVWIPKDLKTEIADAIPEEVYDKIATEEDAIDPKDLKEFLRQKKHPVTEKYWKDNEPQPLELPLPGYDWPGEEE
jgi:acetyl-CoA decarbonylase/synthase complex subunit beta